MTTRSIFYKTAPNSIVIHWTLRRVVLGLGALALIAAFGCGELPDDLGGKEPPTVTFVGPLPRWISWSKQSDAIVFEQAGRLVVARGEDLKDARAITGYSEYNHPSWSPDGRWIVHDRPIDGFRGDDIWARSFHHVSFEGLYAEMVCRRALDRVSFAPQPDRACVDDFCRCGGG